MTDHIDSTTPLEHHRHAPEQPPRNPWKAAAITIAAVLVIGVIAVAIWLIAGRTPSPDPTPSPTPTASPSPTPTPTPTPTAAGPCTTDNSTVELGTPDAAAGSVKVPIIFTNSSSDACTLEGFPTVEFVGDGNGTQIGSTATQDDSTVVALVTVAPGDSAMALLTITTADVEGCSPMASASSRPDPTMPSSSRRRTTRRATARASRSSPCRQSRRTDTRGPAAQGP